MRFLSFLLFLGCAGVSKNPAVVAGAGAVGSEVVRKVIDSAPRFNPYLKIKDFEVCIFSEDSDDEIECTLVLSHEKRTLPKERIEEKDTVFIKKESFLYLLSELEVYCKEKPDECKEKYETYKSIKRVFVF